VKKIGLICLALVLALGALGVGYAHWSDTVTINQTITTGEVACGVAAKAYEYPEAENKDVCTVTVTPGTKRFDKVIGAVPADALFSAGSHAFYDSVTISIAKYYPCLRVDEDFVIANAGTIPIRLEVTPTICDPDNIYPHLDYKQWKIYWIHKNAAGAYVCDLKWNGSGKADVELPKIIGHLEGFQLHPCESLLIYIDKHLQQEAPQGKSASMQLSIECMQWNLYTAP
jgi:predicted ribosomally synthesized peptide with SipW-like signal peptide